MSYTTAFLSVFLLYFLMYNYHCLKVIPERAEIAYYNQSYLEGTPIFNVRRYIRKGDYVINLMFHSKRVFDNTITIDINFYQFLHNEFRRSFPEMHFKLCDLINNDPFIGKSIRDSGMKDCPIQPGKYSVNNMSFNQVIPSVWPFEKGMAEFIATDQNVIVAKALLVLTFKQDLPKLKT